MNIEELYRAVGGDYDAVIGRIQSDAMIIKFLRKFPSDPSFDTLNKAYENGDVKAAFMAAHTLKGTAANLGLDTLSEAADALTEQLRDSTVLAYKAYLNAVETAYAISVEKIALLDRKVTQKF